MGFRSYVTKTLR